MAIMQSELIEIRRIPGKGRGVVARAFIEAGAVIERAPVLVLKENALTESELMYYVYCWGRGTVGVALGYGSLYNHSYSPNARYEDVNPQTKVFIAVRDIHPGEEVTVNYNGEPDDRTDVGFDVVELSPPRHGRTNGKVARSGSRSMVNGRS